MFYGWRMVGLVSAMRVLGGGLHNYGFTVFFLPLSQDLGLSRAATSLAFSLARAEGALEGPFVGYLIDRFGPRPMLLLATVLCGVGYILLAWVDDYTTFLIVYSGLSRCLLRRASSTRRWPSVIPGSFVTARAP